jgi:hypothetical protein
MSAKAITAGANKLAKLFNRKAVGGMRNDFVETIRPPKGELPGAKAVYQSLEH